MYDDLDTETAVLRLKMKGGHGGHNGMRSIIQHFSGSQTFPRLRIGIGRPPGKMPVERYVLTAFTAKEKEEVRPCLTVYDLFIPYRTCFAFSCVVLLYAFLGRLGFVDCCHSERDLRGKALFECSAIYMPCFKSAFLLHALCRRIVFGLIEIC
jgi:hypothetical protein